MFYYRPSLNDIICISLYIRRDPTFGRFTYHTFMYFTAYMYVVCTSRRVDDVRAFGMQLKSTTKNRASRTRGDLSFDPCLNRIFFSRAQRERVRFDCKAVYSRPRSR